MAKTNYTKVEQALDEGLRKMKISKLADLAHIVSGDELISEDMPLEKKQKELVRQISFDLKRLEGKDKKIYLKLQMKKEYLTDKLAHPESLSAAEWKGLQKLQEIIKKNIAEMFPESSDDKIVEEQKELHLKRRHNINEDWLVL